MCRWTLGLILLAIGLSPAFARAKDGALPRVLIIGDQVYNQASREVVNAFKGKAEVVYARWEHAEVPDTTTALLVLDRLLGHVDRNGKPVPPDKRKKWDVIHFNCGLGDLIYRVPKIKQFRVLPIHVGGVRNTDPKRYEANLSALVTRLKSTGAKLIWANTTPIRHSASNVFEKGSEIQYNAIAAKVMAAHKVPTSDMYTHVKGVINMDKPAAHGADPFSFDKKPIHQPIVASVAKALKIAPVPSGKK